MGILWYNRVKAIAGMGKKIYHARKKERWGMKRTFKSGESRKKVCWKVIGIRMNMCFPNKDGNSLLKLFPNKLASWKAWKRNRRDIAWKWRNIVWKQAGIYAARPQRKECAERRSLKSRCNNVLFMGISMEKDKDFMDYRKQKPDF